MARKTRKTIRIKIPVPGKQFLAAAFSVVLSVFLVAVAVYGATTIDTNSVAVGTTTPGAAVAVKGAGIYEGFVHADYFKSTSTNPSWLFGNLGIGTTTPGTAVAVDGAGIFDGFVSANYFTSTSTNDSWLLGGLGLGTTTVSDTLNADGSLAVEGRAIIGDSLTASTLKATSTTATSSTAYGFTVASSSFNVDGASGRVAIGTTTFPQGIIANSATVDPALTVSGLGSTNSATGTIFITNEAGGGGGQIILRSADGNGCLSITGSRAALALDDDTTLVVKVVACPK